MHVLRPQDKLLRSVPVQYYVFDLLHHGKEPLTGSPYTERRARLEDLGLNSDPVHTPPWHRGGADKILAESIAKGLEGVVGKPLGSAYHPGQRRDWIKVKNVKQQEVIIAGWKPGEGRRADKIGSLLLGVNDDDGQLRYAGHVGTGFTDDMLADLGEQLAPLGRETCPFGTKIPNPAARDARWVEPQPGRRGRLRRVDHRRDPAPAELARAADRQGARRGAPRGLGRRGGVTAGVGVVHGLAAVA